LEREEVLAGVRLVEPDAVIPDVVDGLAPLLLDAELYLRLGLSRGDLLGVAQQVLERHPEQPRIPRDRETVGYDEPRGVPAAQVVGHPPREGAQVNLLAPHLLARDAREVQEIVDQVAHAPAGYRDTPQVVLAGLAELLPIVLEQHLAALIPPVAVRLRRDFGALLNLIRAHALLHQASRGRDAEGRIVATIEDYAAVRELVADLVSEGIEATVPATVRETVEAVKRLRENSNGEPVTVAELARELKLDRSAVSRRVRNAKDRGYLRDLEENQRKPSRLILGDELPDDLEILPEPEAVRASMQERAADSSRPEGAQEPHSNAQNSDDAYKACNRVRVQEGIKNPPPPTEDGPEDASNLGDIVEEVRNLFTSDTLEEA
jgi:hypothetical protein